VQEAIAHACATLQLGGVSPKDEVNPDYAFPEPVTVCLSSTTVAAINQCLLMTLPYKLCMVLLIMCHTSPIRT
jgi:hypothetical protein